MMKDLRYDIVVIGGGPAGLAAAVTTHKEGMRTLIVEREDKLGGILKQCIHDGFGLVRYNQRLTGTEYALRFIDQVVKENIDTMLLTFVTGIASADNGYLISVVSRDGVTKIYTKAIIFATGCRERTAKQIFIGGSRPAGVITAGSAQNFVNLHGKMPTKKCVILGSGDIGLIMARRLTLEGAQVLGVYEVKDSPSGLTRNIHQCLYDFDIPLFLSHTVTKVFGRDRLEGVEISKVDEKMQPVKGAEFRVNCDALILSVGLIPENELGIDAGVVIDGKTKGAKVDQNYMTSKPGLFAAGNCVHVNDLVDYVSESAETAGKAAAEYVKNVGKKHVNVIDVGINDKILYVAPSCVDVNASGDVIFYFRSDAEYKNAVLRIFIDGAEIKKKRYAVIKPPEMERIILPLDRGVGSVEFVLEAEL
jgi:thioredoxin reductase